jgi:hypothetical protein
MERERCALNVAYNCVTQLYGAKLSSRHDERLRQQFRHRAAG